MLIFSDFDGTIAETFLPSPNNIGVNQAYEIACEKIWGNVGVKRFHAVGGLLNRAPVQLIEHMMMDDCNWWLENSKSFWDFNKNKAELNLIPEGMGVSLERDTPPLLFMSEVLVRVKLQIMMKEISPEWPLPCKGFLGFYKKFQGDLAIISSGHDLFIQKVFNSWGVRMPFCLITDDVMRSDQASIPLEKRFKPQIGAFIFFEKKYGPIKKDQTVYVGDSLVHDGGLAENFGIPFIWFSKEKGGVDNWELIKGWQ
ncbi:MAG: hypothetical protein K9M40_02465 [Candidatus Pacebacteria bacterium]|nr:hypothetical protein [Candidatus Paceibacterota bacterium]